MNYEIILKKLSEQEYNQLIQIAQKFGVSQGKKLCRSDQGGVIDFEEHCGDIHKLVCTLLIIAMLSSTASAAPPADAERQSLLAERQASPM
jgi:hypothetical protein